MRVICANVMISPGDVVVVRDYGRGTVHSIDISGWATISFLSGELRTVKLDEATLLWDASTGVYE